MANRNARKNGVQLPFMDQAFLDKWQEWLQYRKERRLPAYVPTGLKITFTKLLKDSQNDPQLAIQIIDQSIGNNWQGLFPIKAINNGTTTIPTNTGSNKAITGTSSNRIESLKRF
jgi:hypothetical protein